MCNTPVVSRQEVNKGSLSFRQVPGCKHLVLYPYARDYPTSAKRCKEMGERCGVAIDVDVPDKSQAQKFWMCLKEHTGGVPGQEDTWRGQSQGTCPLNSTSDIVKIHASPACLWLVVRTGNSSGSHKTSERMRHYSKIIQQKMGDQAIYGDVEKQAAKGATLAIQRQWDRDDEGKWEDAARWLKTQQERLTSIITLS